MKISCNKYFAITSIVLFYAVIPLNAQNYVRYDIDSLITILPTLGNDSTKAKILSDIGLALMTKKPDSSLFYLEQSEVLSKKLQEHEITLFVLADKGNLYKSQDENDKAMEAYLEGLKIAEDINNHDREINFLGLIGSLSMKMGDYEEAMNYHHRALVAYKGKEKIVDKEDSLRFSRTLRLVGQTFMSLNKQDSAIYYFNQALKFCDSNNLAIITMIRQDLSDFYIATNKLDSALYHALINKKVAYKLNHYNFSTSVTRSLGEIYMKLGQLDSSEFYLFESLKFAKLSQVNDYEINSLSALQKLYASKSDFQNAYKYILLEQKLLKENVHSEQSKEINRLLLREKNIENELLLKDKELSDQMITNQRVIIFLIVSLVILLVIFGIYMRIVSSKMKFSNDKLKELDGVKTRFFANISHEFRTPLTLIQAPLQRILHDEKYVLDRSEYASMLTNSNRLLRLVNELLDLAKLESGQSELKFTNADINQFIKSVVVPFGGYIKKKSLIFSCEISEDSFMTEFDAEKLEKIIYNLLSNAYKYTPDDGGVWFESKIIDAGNGDHKLYLEVGDTGKGISEDLRPLIFQRFYQIGGSKKNISGTGIGLSLVRELVDVQGGTLVLKSEEDKGTVFMITIPLGMSYAKNNNIPYEHVDPILDVASSMDSLPYLDIQNDSDNTIDNFDPRRKEKPIMLVVDDNVEIRTQLKKLFNEFYYCLEASDGKEGLEKAESNIPDIILMDYMMPEMDGIEACTLIKSGEKTSHIPVILLTARADEEGKHEGLSTGADDYITKPYDMRELELKVGNLIRQRKMLVEKLGANLNNLRQGDNSLNEKDKLFLDRVIGLIEENINVPDFNVEEMQSHLGMSRSQLNRKLKGITGYSPIELLTNMRMEKAAKLLQSSGMNITEVSYTLGYNDPSYFTRCFKKYHKVSPKNFVKGTVT